MTCVMHLGRTLRTNRFFFFSVAQMSKHCEVVTLSAVKMACFSSVCLNNLFEFEEAVFFVSNPTQLLGAAKQ